MEGASLLASSLAGITEKIEGAVKQTREEFGKSTDLYKFIIYSNDVNYGVMKLAAPVVGYAECMTKMGVKTKAELEQLWEKHIAVPEVKEAVDNLLKAERNFTDCLNEIEQKLLLQEDQLTTKEQAQAGQEFPKGHSLIEIPSGKPTSPEACWKNSKFTLFVFLRLFG